MSAQFVVVLTEQQMVYGPFDDRPEAQAFADYLAAEVDPATVQDLRSPTSELLGWVNATRASGGGPWRP